MTSDSTHLTRTALIRSINRSQEESLSTVAEWVLLTLRARPPDPDRLYSTEVAWTWRISTTSQLGSLYDRTIKVGWAKFQSFMIWSTLQPLWSEWHNRTGLASGKLGNRSKHKPIHRDVTPGFGNAPQAASTQANRRHTRLVALHPRRCIPPRAPNGRNRLNPPSFPYLQSQPGEE